MKILVVGDPHGKLGKIKKLNLKKVDLILITGDIGKADLARKRYFENIGREKKGLEELEYDFAFAKKVHMEIYNSTLEVVKYLVKFAPVYSVVGNVGGSMLKKRKMDAEDKKWGKKLPRLGNALNKIKNFNFVTNNVRNIDGFRIGFLEYFMDTNWVMEFKPSNYSESLKEARKETMKAKKILKWFNDVEVLVCHQPPYGVLDKMMNKNGSKHWYGKHAGSKAILDYVKKKQPKYVFCGHMHESKGKKKIGKTEVYNVGVSGDYILLDIK